MQRVLHFEVIMTLFFLITDWFSTKMPKRLVIRVCSSFQHYIKWNVPPIKTAGLSLQRNNTSSLRTINAINQFCRF